MSSTTGPATDGHPFHHVALVYHTAADYVAGTVSFVRSALSRGSPVLVVVPPDNLDLIRTALGDDTRRVSFADMTVVGRNPAALLSGVVSDFVAAHPGQRTAIIGEPVWPERTEVEYPACVAHEALVNTVLAGHDLETLCLYDARRLDTRIVADAYRTHPLLEQRGKRRRSTAYTDPLALVDEFNLPLPPPPADAAVLDYTDRSALPRVRLFVSRQAGAAGLAEERVREVVVAANELASNTVEHTAEGGRVVVWTDPGVLVCQVEDTGYLPDPLVGRLRPDVTRSRGRGLLFVNQLGDLVRVHTRPGYTGFRLHFLL